MADASERLLKLRPVTFRYKQPNVRGERPVQYGLIAEEVQTVFPELVVLNKDGQPETVAYQTLPALLLNEYQKEHKQLEAERALNRTQNEKLALLQRQVDAQGAHLAELATLEEHLAGLERLTAELAAKDGASAESAERVSQRADDSVQEMVAAR